MEQMLPTLTPCAAYAVCGGKIHDTSPPTYSED